MTKVTECTLLPFTSLFPPPSFLFSLSCLTLLVLVSTETVAKTGMILLAGEITSRANVDYQKIVRDAIRHIGYDDSSKGTEMKVGCREF